MTILIDKDGPYILKDPAEVIDISIDWSEWRAAENEPVISSHTWTAPAGMTKVSEANSGDIAAVLISGGTLGQTYRWICTVVAGPKTGVRGLRVHIVER